MGGFQNEMVVERQLLAKGMSHFDVAVRRLDGAISVQRDDLLLAQVKDLCEWLHEQNLKHHEILIRPHGEHGMSLLADLSYQKLQQFRLAGFEPALLIEIGPDLYQLWLKHDRKMPREACERVTRYLAECAGADVDHAHWDSFGYLAGFLIADQGGGAALPVQIVEASGAVYQRAAEICARFAPHMDS